MVKMTLCVLGALCLSGCFGSGKKFPIVEGFDAERYLGTWYEIARLPHPFEDGLTNVTAEYGKGKGKKITVTNKGQREKSGSWSSITGWAYLTNTENKAELKVVFFWPLRSPYRVVALDKEGYQYVMVVSSGTSCLWIMSRQPQLDPGIMNQLIEQAKGLGIDTSKLIMVKHTPQA